MQASRREPWMVGLACFLFFLCLYSWTVAPSVGMGHDTGELTTVCVMQGIPHSPGYPLFVAIGWLAQQLPIGSEPAYRLNLLCALETATAMGFLGAALCLATRPLPALIATLLTGLSTAVWRQAVATEVFALHLLFLCALVWLALLWEQSENKRRREILIWTSFIVGCGLAHQHILVLAAPVFILFGFLSKGPDRVWGFSWTNPLVLLLTAASPYALQFYIAQQKPMMNWMDPSNLDRLLAHFLRKSYGTSMLNEASMAFDERAGDSQVSGYFVALMRNYLPFPAFCLLGFSFDSMARSRKLNRALLFLGIALVYGPLFALWGNQPSQDFFTDLLERFYSSSLIGVGGLIALGIEWLLELGASRAAQIQVLLWLMTLQAAILNYDKCQQRNQYYATDLVRATLGNLPPRSAIFISGDLPAGTADYLRYVKNEFTNIPVIFPGLTSASWYRYRLPAGADLAAQKVTQQEGANRFNDAIYAYFEKRGYNIFSFALDGSVKGFLIHEGIPFHSFSDVAHSRDSKEEIVVLEQVFQALRASRRRGVYRLTWRQNYWTRYCVGKWLDAFKAFAEEFSEERPNLAIEALNEVISMQESVDPAVFMQRGDLYLKQKQYSKAVSDFRTVLREIESSRNALEGLILAYRALGDQSKAHRYEEQLRGLGPPPAARK
ncbi:MAG: DUF2723 domain-containing protein [Vulcanimicrobiota bacterium]